MLRKIFSRKNKDLHSLLDLHPIIAEERARYDNDAVRDVILLTPEVAALKYHFRGIGDARPISVAIALGASLDVVKIMYNACPEALEEKISGRRTPLHYACVHSASVEVVRLLVDGYPGALAEKDCFGCTPLATACRNAACLDVVKFLIENYPQAIEEVDNALMLPLHWACRSRAPLDIVRTLVEIQPSALLKKDHNGNTPLMWAEEEGRRTEYSLPEVVALLRALNCLMGLEANDHTTTMRARDIMVHFTSAASPWWGGVSLVLTKQPLALQSMNLDHRLMPQLLFRIGRDCGPNRLGHMYSFLREQPEIKLFM